MDYVRDLVLPSHKLVQDAVNSDRRGRGALFLSRLREFGKGVLYPFALNALKPVFLSSEKGYYTHK